MKSYQRLTYSEILGKLKMLTKEDSHNIFRLEFGEKIYKDFPRTLCKVDHSNTEEPCQYPILKMTNWDQPMEKIASLPQVLLMAGIHGNETVGSYAMTELAEYIQKNHRSFRHMLNSRMIIILPFVNPQGFSHTQREESHVNTAKLWDPNRDFPYDNTACMNTAVGRFLDQLFRTHLIVNTFIFHGGTTVLAYPWGNYPHTKDKAPDNVSFSQVGDYLKGVASSNTVHPEWIVKPYVTGDMTHTVYPVKGGLEDWAYGGWDRPNVPQCKITDPTPYSLVNTPYKPAMLKAFIYLVEASDFKNPKNTAMGTTRDVLKSGGATDGHISRNIRMSLDFIRVAAPSVGFTGLSYDPKTKTARVEYQAEGCFVISATEVKVSSCLENRLSGGKKLGRVCTWGNVKLSGTKVGKLGDHTKKVVGEWKVSDPTKPVSLKITLSCDQGWAKPAPGDAIAPISHLVNIRTQAETKEIRNHGFSLKSYKSVEYNIQDATPANFST